MGEVRFPVVRWLVLLMSVVAVVPATPLQPTVAGALTADGSGTVRFGDWQFPISLNPFQPSSAVAGEITSTLYSPLLVLSSRGQLRPELVTRVPSIRNGDIRDGGKTIVLRLKRGMRWSSGVEITGADVVLGWQVWKSPRLGNCGEACKDVGSVRALDRYTAVLRLRKPFGSLLFEVPLLPLPHSWPVLGKTADDAAQVVSRGTFTYEDRSSWTNGPFQVTGFARDQEIVLTRMRQYHGLPGPHISRLVFRFYANKQALVQAVSGGDLDVATGYSTPVDVPAVIGIPDLRVVTAPSYVVEQLTFNMGAAEYGGQRNVVLDRGVRQALQLAVDRAAIIQAAGGGNAPQTLIPPAYTPFWAPRGAAGSSLNPAISGTWDPLRHRYVGYGSQAVRDARRLLAEAGYGNGVTVEVKTPAGQPYRAAVVLELARQWSRIGVQLTPHYIPNDWGTWCPTSPLITGDFQVLLHAVAGGPDPDGLRPALDSRDIIHYDPATCTYNRSDGNFGRLHDVRIDRALESAVFTADQKQRARLYGSIEQRLARMAYWIPLYYRPALQLANGRLRGLASSQITWPGAAPGWRAEEWHW